MSEHEMENIVEETVKKSPQREMLEWVISILVAVIIALLIRNYIFTIVRVDGTSMVPTLHHNDRLIVWRLGYNPKKGDIIVLHQKGERPFIKRKIATEGQTVDIDFDTQKVYVDGVEQDEPFINEPTAETGDMEFPVKVEENTVFVMGDNRNNSKDSRFKSVGLVDNEDVLGQAVVRFFPFNSACIFK